MLAVSTAALSPAWPGGSACGMVSLSRAVHEQGEQVCGVRLVQMELRQH